MGAVGGSIQSITINGREFPIAADAEIQRKLGGWENESQSNGDGSARIVKTRVPPSLSGIVTECDDDRGDQEFLQAISDGNVFVPTALTYASGNVYQGSAIITSELQESSQNATCAFDMMGEGVFTKQ